MYTITYLNTHCSLIHLKLFQQIIRSDIYLSQDIHTVDNVESL